MARWGVSFANACRMRLCEGVLRCATHPDALNDRPTACARVREASFWLHRYRADKTERMPDTRGHILDAATELFAHKGYDATSIRDIAELAKVAPGLIHHHFGNKSTLLLSVCERVAAWTKEQRQVRFLAIADASLDDRIEAFVRDTFEMACLRPDYIRLIGMAMYSQEIWEDAELGELVWTTLAFNLAKIVEEYVEAYPDLGMPTVMQAGMGVFGACLIRFVVTPDGDEPSKDEAWHERRRAWCKTMTRIWTSQLLPHTRPPRSE